MQTVIVIVTDKQRQNDREEKDRPQDKQNNLCDTVRQTDSQSDRKTDRQTNIQKDRQTERQTDKKTERKIDRLTDRQIDRLTDRKKEKERCIDRLKQQQKNIRGRRRLFTRSLVASSRGWKGWGRVGG